MLNRKINNLKDVELATADLERNIKAQEGQIKLQMSDIKESMKPKVLFKNTFSYLAETPEIQKIVVNTAIGFILGYAAKKSVKLLSDKSLNRSAEDFVKHHLTRLEENAPQSLLSKGISLIRKFTPQSSPLYTFVKY